MNDMQAKIEERRRILEQLAGMIPGYSQYQQQEKRRDADKQNRDFLYAELRTAVSDVGKLALSLTGEGKLEALADIDRVERKLRTVADRIRLADYGYAGFFDAFKIQEQELDMLYQFDLSLAALVKQIKDAGSKLSSMGDKTQALADLDKAIEELDSRFDEREKVIMGVR
jgi:hypothetical protein